MDAESPAVDVFISCSSDDVELAETVERSLDTAGICAWRDRTRLGAGEVFRYEVVENIRRSTIGLCLVSETYVAKQWCNHEAALLFENAAMLTVRVDDSLGYERIGGLLARLDIPSLGVDFEDTEGEDHRRPAAQRRLSVWEEEGSRDRLPETGRVKAQRSAPSSS